MCSIQCTSNTVTRRPCNKTKNTGFSFQVQCEYLSLDSMEKWIICKFNPHSIFTDLLKIKNGSYKDLRYISVHSFFILWHLQSPFALCLLKFLYIINVMFLVHVFHNVFNILATFCLQSLWCCVTHTSRRLSYGTFGRQHYSRATSYNSVGMKSCTFTATSTPSLKVWRGRYYQ